MREIDTTLIRALKEYPEVNKLTLTRGRSVITRTGSDMSVMDKYIIRMYGKANPRVRIILDNDKPVAWGWILRYNVGGYDKNSLYRKYRSLGFMTYIEPSYRRRGIGASLYRWGMDISKRQHRRIFVFPHDDSSRGFYSKLEAKNKRGF